MATVPAYTAPPPAIPDSAPPQHTSSDASSPCQPGQESPFARLLHQVRDQNESDSGKSEKDAQEKNKDKVATQPSTAAPAAVPVSVQPQKVVPFSGLLSLSGTEEKSENVQGISELAGQAATDGGKKSQAVAGITSGVSLLMHSIVGFSAPQVTQQETQGKPASRQGTPLSPIVPTPSARTQLSLAGTSDNASASPNNGETLNAAPQAPLQSDLKAPVSAAQLAFAARLHTNHADVEPASSATPTPQKQTSVQPQAPAPAAHAQAGTPKPASQAADESADTAQASTPAPQATSQQAPAETSEKTERAETHAPPSPAASEAPAAPRADASQKIDQPADVRSAEMDPAPAANANNTAVRDVRLQVAGAGDQRVDVRVMDRGGELRVSVRADDPSLVRSLQDNVAELSTRLDQAHFRSEVWTPRTQAVEQTNSANTNGRTFSNGEDTLGREARGQQQNGRQQQQPAWVDDFEENPAAGKAGSFTPWQR